jgi:large conductance mechanosensitive channel protein
MNFGGSGLSRFEVYKDYAGKYRFRFKAENNRIVAVGEAYEKHASCINGIKSIKKNCKVAIEDQTIEDSKKLPNPKYEVYKDAANKFRFRLKAGNGQIIAESEGYETKDACLNGVEVVGTAHDAEIEDLTVTAVPTGDDLSSIKAEESPKIGEVTSVATAELKLVDSGKKDEMLEELKKIRLSVEKGPAPQPPKGFWNEFKDFLKKFGVLALAVGFIIGLYLGGVVQALVKDLLLPAIGLLIPGMDNLATVTIGPFAIGDFLVALITFIFVALVVFLIVKIAKGWKIE